jgi:hypothetical protein
LRGIRGIRGIRGVRGVRGVRGMRPDLLVFGAGLLAGTMNGLAGGGSFTLLFFARAYLKGLPW